jgi:hypothetical protein
MHYKLKYLLKVFVKRHEKNDPRIETRVGV